MRKTKLSILLAVGAIAAYYVLTPRMAVNGLAAALESRDTVEIDERVDFDRVRDGLKAQVQDVIVGETAGTGAEGNPLAALGTGLAMMLADGLIDSFVTPGSLSSMSRGMAPGGASAGDSEPFDQAEITREGLDRFSATVTDGDHQVRWVFHRDGLRWVLVNIVVDRELLTASLG